MKTSLFLTTALTAFLVAGAANAEKTTFVAENLAGDKVLPDEVNTNTQAKVVLTFDSETKKLCGKLTFTQAPPDDFTGSAVRVHEGDDKAENGGVVATVYEKDFTGGAELKLSATLESEDDITKLTGGDTYIDVDGKQGETTFPNGYIRDQLTKDDSVDPVECDDATTGDDDDDSDAGTGTGNGDGSGDGSGKDAGSSSGDTKTADSTDDGGCNTSGSSSGNALALLAGLGAVIVAASRKRKKA